MNVWLDDQINDPDAPERHPPKDWVGVTTPQEAVDLLKTGEVEWISLDNDLGLGTGPMCEGYQVMDWIEAEVYAGRLQKPFHIMIHTRNAEAERRMKLVRYRIHAKWNEQKEPTHG